MKKSQNQSLDQYWKLDDKQLNTPDHDEMLLWILKPGNLKKLITSRSLESENWDWKNVKIHAEEYIVSNSGFRVGAPDIIFLVPHYICKTCNTTHNDIKNCPNCNSEDITPHPDRKHRYDRYFVEIKPKIENFGTTLRQLKLFISYGYEERAYLCTRDLRFKDEFEGEGIKVLHQHSVQSSF
ncbi:MAG: hypothetical protein F8N15_10485 [Methanobacterium sp.]|nr:hypothetical protein [Methanobacterium sp.]